MSQASENPSRPLAWPYWLWEGSSVAGWLCVAPLLWQLVRRLPRLARRAALLVAGLAAATVVPRWHVTVMFGLRFAIYPLVGESYRVVRRCRRDLRLRVPQGRLDAAQMGLGFYFIQWLMVRVPYWSHAPGARPSHAPKWWSRCGTDLDPFRPARRDRPGRRGRQLRRDRRRGRTLLHRTTLTALEVAWAAHGFVRIHRGTLVRAAATVRVETLKSGDFIVELATGACPRSRRYRAELDEA